MQASVVSDCTRVPWYRILGQSSHPHCELWPRASNLHRRLHAVVIQASAVLTSYASYGAEARPSHSSHGTASQSADTRWRSQSDYNAPAGRPTRNVSQTATARAHHPRRCARLTVTYEQCTDTPLNDGPSRRCGAVRFSLWRSTACAPLFRSSRIARLRFRLHGGLPLASRPTFRF